MDQNEAMESSERVLGRLEAAAENLSASATRIETKFDQHAVADEHSFRLLREGIGELRDRIANLEPIGDMVEAHGDAIRDFEHRFEEAEEEKRIRASVELTNRRWAKAVVGLAGVAAGAGGASMHERFFKWMGTLFK